MALENNSARNSGDVPFVAEFLTISRRKNIMYWNNVSSAGSREDMILFLRVSLA